MLIELRKANDKRSIDWTGHTPCSEDIPFMAIEMGGEAGEVMDAVKKLLRFKEGMAGGINRQDSKKAIADELADLIICADRLASGLDIDLSGAVISKFNGTSEKHGFKSFQEYLGLEIDK